MKKYLLLASALFVAQYTHAAPLSAVMTFESTTITAEGVKKQTHFQERFIRDTNIVWSERIIPKATAHQDHEDHSDHADDGHGHEHNLNFATAGKWLVRDANNQIKFRLVREDEKKIIEPRVTEYGTLGFDGVWETAYYLVNRTALKKMTPLKKTAPAGAVWYEQKNAKQFTRILWDEHKEIPLVIESGSADGSSSNKISLAIVPTTANLPWNTLGSFQTIAYEDLLD